MNYPNFIKIWLVKHVLAIDIGVQRTPTSALALAVRPRLPADLKLTLIVIASRTLRSFSFKPQLCT